MRSRAPRVSAATPRKLGLCKGELASLAPKYAVAARSRVLHLSYLGLYCIPEHVFALRLIIRLDVGHNELVEISPSVGDLGVLEELWVNDNPIRALPTELGRCRKLRVLDARRTRLEKLPAVLGRLQLDEIDIGHTPYAASSPDDTPALLAHLAMLDERETLTKDMMDRASAGIYREVSDRDAVRGMVAAVADEFAEVADLRNVVRNCDRLLPRNVGSDRAKAARRVREKFVALRRDNDRKRASAELELKMRALYYDRIDPAKVEGYIKAIYEKNDDKPLQLEDVRFLVQHAPRLFPDDPSEIEGRRIRDNVWTLQEKLTEDRASCVRDVVSVLKTSVYADVEPPLVDDLARAVCDQFKRDRFATKAELRDLKKLAADAHLVFPPEFHKAKPAKVRAAFKQHKG
ncbi:hypothetical protein CTAYLR_006231 [Chrysophaeum taylorii]|uniref:Uncharacterized protein n=1 Tax=Chrysophaeum taylorii TaxID=2483200 RepID=A0AAD7XH86_9STRA|nr:hypothetical protein CTAYLR_006231 [Chrysophaeum taylorii]